MESYSARNIDFEDSKELAILEYLTNYIASDWTLKRKISTATFNQRIEQFKTWHI